MEPKVHLIRIHPQDNVLVLSRSAAAGTELTAGDLRVRLETDLGLGHKIAARAIGKGEKILKYGMPIGSATREIGPGEHVHLHNMTSDYLPTYTHEEGRRYTGEAG